jgi:hypothetical protein
MMGGARRAPNPGDLSAKAEIALALGPALSRYAPRRRAVRKRGRSRKIGRRVTLFIASVALASALAGREQNLRRQLKGAERDLARLESEGPPTVA